MKCIYSRSFLDVSKDFYDYINVHRLQHVLERSRDTKLICERSVNDRYFANEPVSAEIRENSRKRCKTAKTGVFRRRFTSACNTTKIRKKNSSRILAKKRLVEQADVLR